MNRPDDLAGVTHLQLPGNNKDGPFFVQDHPRGSWFVQMSPVAYTNMAVRAQPGSPLFRRGTAPVQPADRRRYSWGGANYLDRYFCGVCVSISDGWLRGPETCVPIHDFSERLPVV